MENSTNIIKVYTKMTVNTEVDNEDDDYSHVESESYIHVNTFTSIAEAAKEFEEAAVGYGEDGNSLEIIAVTDSNDHCIPIDWVTHYQEPAKETEQPAQKPLPPVYPHTQHYADDKNGNQICEVCGRRHTWTGEMPLVCVPCRNEATSGKCDNCQTESKLLIEMEGVDGLPEKAHLCLQCAKNEAAQNAAFALNEAAEAKRLGLDEESKT